MIDIHCHLLPGIGDGPSSSAESRRMLAECAAAGVTGIVAVCHYERGLRPRILRAVEELRPEAEKLGIKLDYAVEYNFVDLEDADEIFTIGGKYFLLDFASADIPYATPQALEKMKEKGFLPLIVHPEKLFRRPALFKLCRMIRPVPFFVLNAPSFLPGSRFSGNAWWMMQQGMVRAVASDAHTDSAGSRPVRMRECMELLTRKCGKFHAEMILSVNPERLLDGDVPIPPGAWERPSLWTKLISLFRR